MLPLCLLWVLPTQAAPQDIWVQAPSPADRARLQGRSDLGFAEGTRGDWIRLHAEPPALRYLTDAGLHWVAVPPPPPGVPVGYHTPEEMADALVSLTASPLAQRVQLGESHGGRPIEALRITAADTPEAHWRILGAHHGDELPSGEVALAFAAHLIDSYGIDPELTAALERDAIWVVPHINPDGVAGVSRYNAGQVDLNRNYGHQWREDAYRPGEAPFSEPETRAVRALEAWNPFTAGLSLHAGASNLGWVWNFTNTPAPDDHLVASMAEDYASACGAPDFWITNGADWYTSHGDTTDWSYGAHGVLDFTLEVSADKSPPHATVADIVADHLPAMQRFVAWPHRATGQVTDAVTGRGIPATVSLIDGGQPVTTGLGGRFARLLAGAQPIDVEVSAQGYTPRTVTLTPGKTHEDIWLQPESLGVLVPEPALLSQGGDGTFFIDGASVSVSRPGEARVLATARGGGRWRLPVVGMAAGAWDLEVDGVVMPRGLFIGEVDSRVHITETRIQGDTLTVSGGGFGYGSQAVALWGEDRAPVPLPVERAAVDTLLVDVSSLDGTELVDVLVLSRGYQLTVHDALGSSTLDADPPDVIDPDLEEDRPRPDGDTGIAKRASEPRISCTSSGVVAAWWWTTGLGIAATRRRRA